MSRLTDAVDDVNQNPYLLSDPETCPINWCGKCPGYGHDTDCPWPEVEAALAEEKENEAQGALSDEAWTAVDEGPADTVYETNVTAEEAASDPRFPFVRAPEETPR